VLIEYLIAGEEDISRLEPDVLLYMAAAAHNLPVMCEALALGADKQWANSKDRGRCALHQAVLSVSFIVEFSRQRVYENALIKLVLPFCSWNLQRVCI